MFPHVGIRHRLPVDLDRLFVIPQAQLGFEQLFGIDVGPASFDRARCAGRTGGQFTGRDGGVIWRGSVDLRKQRIRQNGSVELYGPD